MANRGTAGPKFIRYFGPLVAAIKELGGSGRPDEVEDIIIRRMNIAESQQSELLASGASRLSNQIHWARHYMAKAGYLDSSVRGVWSLTESGWQLQDLTSQEALAIFKQVRQGLGNDHSQTDTSHAENDVPSTDEPQVESSNYRTEVTHLMMQISAAGFERLCQRLLRESGFERVTVTGRTGDGGIDGIGILQINRFVSFKVLFQCKKYADSVGASQVCDFRGAMMGRADKGLILTTGTFTTAARTEAMREGVPQIELVDGEKLIELFETLEFGLKPRKTYDVDREFFEQFM